MEHVIAHIAKLEAEREQHKLILESLNYQIKALKIIVHKKQENESLPRPDISKVKTVGHRKEESNVNRDNRPTILALVLGVFSKQPNEALTTSQIVAELRDTYPYVNTNNISAILGQGVKKGFFKRLVIGGVSHQWKLNQKLDTTVKRDVTKGFTRPNYGIGKAVVDEVNKVDFGVVFSAYSIMKKLQEQKLFPEATVMTIQSVLNKICANHAPGFKKHAFGDNISFSRKQVIHYDMAK